MKIDKGIIAIGLSFFTITATADFLPPNFVLYDTPLNVVISGKDVTIDTCQDFINKRGSNGKLESIKTQMSDPDWSGVVESLTRCSVESQLREMKVKEVESKTLDLRDAIKHIPASDLPSPLASDAIKYKNLSILQAFPDVVVKDNDATTVEGSMSFNILNENTYITTTGYKFMFASIGVKLTGGTWNAAYKYIIHNTGKGLWKTTFVDYNTVINDKTVR